MFSRCSRLLKGRDGCWGVCATPSVLVNLLYTVRYYGSAIGLNKKNLADSSIHTIQFWISHCTNGSLAAGSSIFHKPQWAADFLCDNFLSRSFDFSIIGCWGSWATAGQFAENILAGSSGSVRPASVLNWTSGCIFFCSKCGDVLLFRGQLYTDFWTRKWKRKFT